jgi:hypothetical protein
LKGTDARKEIGKGQEPTEGNEVMMYSVNYLSLQLVGCDERFVSSILNASFARTHPKGFNRTSKNAPAMQMRLGTE